MEQIVERAIGKWPNVPAVYGWLALERRGKWLIKGEAISNPAVNNFINRNYECDKSGQWFFQNGPQRVFVALDYTPFVYRLNSNFTASHRFDIESHTGKMVTNVSGVWIDDAGIVLVNTEYGIGVIDDRDLDHLLPCFTDVHGSAMDEETASASIENLQMNQSAKLWFSYHGEVVPVLAIRSKNVPSQFSFVQRPIAPADQEPCP